MLDDDLPTDVAELQADLKADREVIRLLAAQLVKQEKRFSLIELWYLANRGTFRPTQKLREMMRRYRAMPRPKGDV